jgi:tight adherence protein C
MASLTASLSFTQILAIILFAIAVMCATGGIAMIAFRAVGVKDRVASVGSKRELGEAGKVSRWISRLVEPFSKLSKPKDLDDISGMRAKFARAGWRGPSVIPLFFGLKAVIALLLPFIVLFGFGISGVNIPQQRLMFVLLIAAALGYYLPSVYLARTQRFRQREIFEAFPDGIDLMVVCVEAGLGLDMAINRTAKEMTVRSPALADEMSLIGIELRMGATRERALRNFAARTGVAEISMFAAMVLQAERFGTSIADSLRVHADELRLRRRLRAEEAAAKIPLKLLFPLIFMIFPALLLVLLGPSFIQIVNTLSGISTK